MCGSSRNPPFNTCMSTPPVLLEDPLPLELKGHKYQYQELPPAQNNVVCEQSLFSLQTQSNKREIDH